MESVFAVIAGVIFTIGTLWLTQGDIKKTSVAVFLATIVVFIAAYVLQ